MAAPVLWLLAGLLQGCSDDGSISAPEAAGTATGAAMPDQAEPFFVDWEAYRHGRQSRMQRVPDEYEGHSGTNGDLPGHTPHHSGQTTLHKCQTHWRYLPDPVSPSSMSELHAACVRMVSADYCGDGTSATIEGTPIDVWDTAGVHTKEPDSPGHGFEAAWTSKGAVCVDHLRWPELGRQCASALPICRSPEEAKAIAKQKGLGEVLLFNASCKGHHCRHAPVRAP
ncbi:ADYC domain-containing protein [Sorangium sp. So ce1504]|uniref:ADYC domain-containing protein n=1 Tax=Sorangium sp. So ce1504 TaxID=3133337 RepID=UPI003F5D643C